MRAKHLLPLFLALWLAAGCRPPLASPTPEAAGSLAIYLLPRADSPPAATQIGPNTWGEPVLTQEDVLGYAWQTHTLTLTPAAAQRLAAMRPPTTGRPFLVCVGSESIYRGAFWPAYSSASFDGVVIDPIFAAQDNTVQIALGYPTPANFGGKDPRADPRIRAALARAGKLR
jgi:hypothetical protein